ncbi:MAG TPA: hypothetical protein VE823_17445 [Geodermatophilus sp.]|nr:hypothetical protein [Geodermatophilus sp.]
MREFVRRSQVAAQAPSAPAQPAPRPAPEPPRAEPARPEPARAEPQPEPEPTEPTRTEPARPEPVAARPPADDGWPETTPPGSGAAPRRPGAPAPAAPAPAAAEERRPPRVAVGEPDIPLPPEPTDDEDWPHPPQPAAAEAAAARVEQPRPAATSAPRAAAESSPAPRGSEPMPLVTANPPEPAGDGSLDAGDVRRVWPELLKVVRGQKRTTEALLRSAQVQDLTNGVLTIAATSPALAKMLGDDLNKDIVRQALQELLGVRWKVQVVVAGADQPAPGRTVSPEAAREAARAAEAAEASELMAERAAEGTGGDREPEPAVDPEQAALSLLRTHLGARPLDG